MQSKASEAAFKKTAKDYQVLLLSMHSLVDDDNPKFSTLLFTDSSSVNDDDLLYALEFIHNAIESRSGGFECL